MEKVLQFNVLNNLNHRRTLLKTGEQSIIEFTYWWDDFFGITHDSMTGANILGKLLEETRSFVKKCI